MSNIRPMQDNVLIQFLPPPKLAPGGIIFLPDTAKPEQTLRAEVVAVGPGYYRDSGHGRFIPTTLKPGDVVLVERQAGQDYSLDVSAPRQNAKGADWGDTKTGYRMVREEEVLAVVEEAND
ncbi:MAG TPA: co-chaperone GroES [Polyangiaceae bacterium]|nr:co-chaperone GroES [Polyangiaceae bacterium]